VKNGTRRGGRCWTQQATRPSGEQNGAAWGWEEKNSAIVYFEWRCIKSELDAHV
jgi:hypothetical protein